ncbi:MAG: hypothetical protein BGN88_08705 [Clostridiales bacterium 43-6]|nr:MAG: hypothetical protein BGN88_08705 [Clostridiales bacterium 43-6]
MKCKYCGQDLPDEIDICSSCKKSLLDEESIIETPEIIEEAGFEVPVIEESAIEAPVPIEESGIETPVSIEDTESETPVSIEDTESEAPVPIEEAENETPVPIEEESDITSAEPPLEGTDDESVEIIEVAFFDNTQTMEAPPEPVAVTPPKRKKRLAPVIVGVLLAFTIVAGLFTIGFMSSTPQASATRLYTALFNNDADQALKNILLPEGLTESEFKETVKALKTDNINKGSLSVTDVKPEGFTEKALSSIQVNGKETTDFRVLYATFQVDGERQTAIVYMIKNGKSFLLFNKWLVYPMD